MTAPVIAIVIPCFNEAQALAMSVTRLLDELHNLAGYGKISSHSYIMCCDDGSTDSTWSVIRDLHTRHKSIKGLSLTINRGQQYALFAGLMAVKNKCDAAITIDADLQDDPAIIKNMIDEFGNGAEVVYGVRQKRRCDSWFKRISAARFYTLQQQLGLGVISNHADFRLMSNRAITFLSEYGEQNLFLRGIIPQIGLKTAIVGYDRQPRVAGKTKYPLRKMLSFSIDGITSFSSRPIRLILIIGLVLLFLDIVMSTYVFVSYFGHDVIPGWTSLMLSVWFLGSILLIGLGIVGEYIGKIYVEVKQRPRYFIRETLND